MVKFTIGLFQREVISMQSNFNSLQKLEPNVGAKMPGSNFDVQ